MSTFNSFMGGGFKKAQTKVGTNASWVQANGGVGGNFYIDVAIDAVDVNRACVRGIYTVSTNASSNMKAVSYRLINATTVRCEAWGFQVTSPNWYGFVVEEYR